MTDGTSQGLFIVVAIVIFGVFVVMAYILFEDTLSPALANMFTTATEQAKEDIRGYKLLHQDHSFSKFGDTTVYQARPGTSAEVSSTTKYLEDNTLKITFSNGSDGSRTGTDDLVVFFNQQESKRFGLGDTFEVSYFAKADSDVKLGNRLGGYYDGKYAYSELTTEWKEFHHTIKATDLEEVDAKMAYIFWSEEPSTVWLSDLEIRAYSR